MPPQYKRQKTIEETYQKLSQLDHILLRPDSYVGSIETQKEWHYIYSDKDRALSRKEVQYVPGLYKIFDEILVNAADNFTRDPQNMTYIKIVVDDKDGFVSIENNGMSLPVEMHKEHQMYVPELVFGHLLTSDNYDDGEKKLTGGRNGYGAKLTNIFSTRFEVECADSGQQKRFHQSWHGNMRNKGTAKITSHKGDSFTKVTFWPDFGRFGMKKLDKDIVGLMSKRCLDMAGTTPRSVKVSLNGRNLEVKDFKDYCEMYAGDQELVHEQISERWDVAVTVSDGQFQQVSFVNHIATLKGGTHVTHVADQFIESILKKVNKQNKGGMEVKPHHVRSYLWVFVNSKIENPSFDSQTKETMTLKQAKFGSKCDVDDNMINKVIKSTGIVDMVCQWAKAKEEIDLGKSMKNSGSSGGNKKAKRLLNIPKLEDANLAGGRDGHECTLILTEGDSAKSLAVAGLSIIGRDRYGVFPLRGKLLNVRDATFSQTMANAEISSLAQILGIQPKKSQVSTREMRYGHLMVMTDQDYDGSHIKGLILNLMQHWWPSLFQNNGFLQEFVTPIVKVTKRAVVQQFFTMQEYEQWKENHNQGRGWQIKYYKGLGTSTTQEAKEYFSRIDHHSLNFEYEGEDDAQLIDLAFNKKRADDRKEWINSANDEDFVDHSQAQLSYTDFVQKELVQFAKYDVLRSIPNFLDGFKPVQRKIIWASFKRNLKSDTKVAQLAGYISEHSAYHHGEASLQGAIITLAQTFVGSNNINLLTPSGQFGTRIQGGKDAASSRYIYTRLEKIARLIFHPSDSKLLTYHNEEGQSIEPHWFMPVIPLVLVNGADGIGTGWSTFAPNYNPRDIIANLKRYIRCEPIQEMCPWYAGFKGSIVPSMDKDGWEVLGTIEKRSTTSLEITELPVRKWTQDYKEFLTSLLPTAEGSSQIEDFREYHTEVNVHFVIAVTEDQMRSLEAVGLEKAFKLRSSLPTSNMVFFDREGKIQKFANDREIVEQFAHVRLEFYHKRKAYLIRVLMQQLEIISAKARFIKEVIEEKLKVKNRKRDALIEDLRKHGFRTIYEITEGDDIDVGDEGAQKDDGEKKAKNKGGWDYLAGMPLWTLTMERVLDLERQKKEKQEELDTLENTAPEEMWEEDLEKILDELDELELGRRKAAKEDSSGQIRQKRERSGKPVGLGDRLRARARLMGGGGSDLLSKGQDPASMLKRSAAPAQTSTTPGAAPMATSGGGARLLAQLQAHVLSRTSTEFPELFKDVEQAAKPDTSALGPPETGLLPGGQKSTGVSISSFAKKSVQVRGSGGTRSQGRGRGSRSRGQGRGRGRKK